MRKPEIDLGVCTECDGCIASCPAVFQRNEAVGYIEVIELDHYPVDEVNDAIRDCPVDCIAWVEE
ncbi:MAG: ferredoxin [Desulfobacterales bacterium]|nr:ferredoxin [Desulfobacterales bacterium]